MNRKDINRRSRIVKISNVDFGSGAGGFEARLASNSNATIDIIFDDVNNLPMGSLQVSATGGLRNWQIQSADVSASGLHDLFLRANGQNPGTDQHISGFGGINVPEWIDDLTPAQVNTAFGNGSGQLGLSILRSKIPVRFAAEADRGLRHAG